MLLCPWGVRAGYGYDLNVMPLDAGMPDAGQLTRATDILAPPRAPGGAQLPVAVFGDEGVQVTAVAVMHGGAAPAPAYRFDTAGGSVVFSGDTAASDDLAALAQGAGILVHAVAGLGPAGRDRDFRLWKTPSGSAIVAVGTGEEGPR